MIPPNRLVTMAGTRKNGFGSAHLKGLPIQFAFNDLNTAMRCLHYSPSEEFATVSKSIDPFCQIREPLEQIGIS